MKMKHILIVLLCLFTIRNVEAQLPAKTILNYNCKGLQIEDDRCIIKVFCTTEAPVKLSHFNNFNGNSSINLPNIDSRIPSQFSNGLIMEMKDRKKSKNNVIITAKSLENKSKQIDKSEYKVMDLFSGAKSLKN